ncbi:quinone-dependent dihydroorotate dehydrogenase [Parvularcula sp. LCG005]|uniref:quinone-dependent dihydroorotate dehydrogenase n=1 Tax=Parvularcula sp. LCG005 TaxID=3078805 RepID=UPI0029426F05|nr:quinone-dependent dihydroorotate dehydrogenase [Parvularcula sp. LCG005]WOI53863.1 quinone-dependent dihydroorotate dehydrogenase [Parvularcula sp. LCG005]
MSLWRYGTFALSFLDPERAHRLTVQSLKTGVGARYPQDRFPALATTVAGLSLPNPLGLAAGFDKNAEVPDAMLRMGFGFVEVGASTPKPQPGNDRPRVFRLRSDRAIINRYGFNNEGQDVIAGRLARRAGKAGIIGINLGANKSSVDRTADFVSGIRCLGPHVDFCTVNVSSPNTPGLRALQDASALSALLSAVLEARPAQTPVFLKVAPDLTDEDKADIASVALSTGIDGLIVSNTTIGLREGLKRHGEEMGGLSGRPLFPLSTAVLHDFAKTIGGRLPLIGVGGIAGPQDAYTKILKGASLVQLYTALVYKGPDLVSHILEGLNERLAVDGFSSVADAVGRDV